MEIRGIDTSVCNNSNFKAVKSLFDENAVLSSKNITKTTAPACWEGKAYEVEIQTDDGTPVTFLLDVPNKPNESGTPETAWYVPEEQLDEMLNTSLYDLIESGKFCKAYVDKDKDGNPEFVFGDDGYYFDRDDNGHYFSGKRISIDENSNGIPEYKLDFRFLGDKEVYRIAGKFEEFDEDEDGEADTYNKYSDDGALILQKKYENKEMISHKEWNNNGILTFENSGTKEEGYKNVSRWDDNGKLISKIEYIADENGKATQIYTGNIDTNNPEEFDLMFDAESPDVVKELYDEDMDGKYERTAEHEWETKGKKTIRKSKYDENGDGITDYYGKLTIKETDKSTEKNYTYIKNIKQEAGRFFKKLFN